MNRLTLILVATLTLLTGCFRPSVRGDGVIKTEDRPISDFSKIVVTGGYEIKWSGGKPALKITTDQNLLPLIATVVNGDTLEIGSTNDLSPTKGITIILSSAALTGAQLTGGNSFTGSQITGPDLKLESTGASDITVDGSVTNLEVNFTGAGHLDAKSLQAQTSDITLVGASDADVTVTDTLKASITGAGSLTYSGNPKSVEQNITGAGTIQKRP